MSNRAYRLTILIVFLFSLFQPNTISQAVDGAAFFASPSAIMPGGYAVFSGFGFPPDSDVEIWFLGPVEFTNLGMLHIDFSGNILGSLQFQMDIPAGAYDVMAAPLDVITPITILPALTLDLTPAAGPPGAVVHFIVNNLTAGQLRLDYDGVPVFGPEAVSSGLFEGDFLAPADRPAILGADVEVQAVNMVGDSPIGLAAQFFTTQEPDPTPYSITNVILPPDGVNPGFTFPISGQISPPLEGPLQNYELKILWKANSGQVAPITVGTPILTSTSFSAEAQAPSLLAGDPLIAGSNGQVGVSLINLGFGKGGTAQVVPWLDPPDPVFKVKVVNTNGQPIQGALVDVRAFYSTFGKVEGETTNGTLLESSYSNLSQHPNQISAYLGGFNQSESDPFTCATTNVYGRTDANGEFSVVFDPEMIAMLGKKVFLGNLPKPTYLEVPMEIEFPFYVNALHRGYGITPDGEPAPSIMEMRFSGYTHLFYDILTGQVVNTNPIIVTLPALPAGTKITVPIIPKAGYAGYTPGMVVGGFSNYLGTGIPMTAFGRFYSFPAAQFPSEMFVSTPNDVVIEFQHEPLLFGSLDESSMKLTLNGEIYNFVNSGPKFEGDANCQAIVYRATIPNLYRFPAGNYSGLIEVKDLSVPANITKHYVQVNVFPAPTWVLQPQYIERHIYANYFGAIKIQGFQYPPAGPDSTSNLDTHVPKVGFMQNRVTFGDEVTEMLYADKTSGVQYKSQSDNMVMSQSSDEQKYTGTVAGGKEIVIPTTTTTILDTGKMPLYRHVIGVPPIAGATLGADMWIDATLTTGGVIKFLPNGTTSTSLLVYPDATVGVDAFLEGEVLFGLASVSAHATPDIGMGMPANFVNGSLQDTQKCFHYKLEVSWKAKIGYCPACKKWSDSDTIFNDRKPPSCAPPPPPSSPSVSANYLTAVTPEPPTASPSLATDGFGHTLLIWSDESNNLQSKLLSGSAVIGQYSVINTNRSIDPQVAFYQPNQALAVWAESSLASPDESNLATIEQIFDAQHLKYALWNGSSWSPAQNLTLPADSKGDGKVVLAGCLSAKSSCPLNGEITAVWVRDTGTAYGERKFRLYYAVFNGAGWSSATSVDPSSTGTDSEPTLAYSPSGVAQLAWVRDSDRSLSTVSDRQIFHRQLSDGSPVSALSSLPPAAVEPSLAVNSSGEMMLAFTVATDPLAFIGNQRQLHAAKQSCGGSGCNWTSNALTDINSRPVHAESPILTINDKDQAQITYRALGFGPATLGGPSVLPGDPLGTILGTGEIGQAFITINNQSTASISPSYQTLNGYTVWQLTAVFDPLIKMTYAAASQGPGPTLPQQTSDMLASQGFAISQLSEIPETVALEFTASAIDFSISDITVNTKYPQLAGEPLTVLVSILNNGPAYTSDPDNGLLDMTLTWDAPAGTGIYAGSVLIDMPIEAGGIMIAEFTTGNDSLILPDKPHLPHTLFVQTNSAQLIAENNFENNLSKVPIGGLPAPQGLTGAAQPGDSSVFLEWQPVDHEGVAGYRIYRSLDGRIFEPVGSSFIPGFVDLSGVAGQTYLYTVVSYAIDGFESSFADPIQAVIGQIYEVNLPIISR